MVVNPYDGAGYGCGIGYGYCGAPSGAVPLLLDTIDAYAAWSLRKLKSTHEYAIRVRRSSDNSEQDIGFVGGVLDTASLLTFCGAGDGFIVKKYDATGNSRDWTQPTTTRQTRIVSSGAVEVLSSLPSERYVSGEVRGAYNAALDNKSRLDYYAVWAVSNEDTYSAAFSVQLAATPYAFIMRSGSSSTIVDSDAGTPTYWKSGAQLTSPTRDSLYTAFANAGIQISRTMALNTTASGWPTTGVTEGYNDPIANFTGRWFESIVIDSDSTSLASSIETDMADFYGVTLA